MTYKIRGVRVEEYSYYANKLRQKVGLETLLWSQIVTSQRPLYLVYLQNLFKKYISYIYKMYLKDIKAC